MKVVTDSAANISPQRCAEMEVEVVPFKVTFHGNTYLDGIDITPAELYRQYDEFPNEYPLTSQPSVGDFVSFYENLGDEEVLSIHLSSGLSGTYSSAENAAQLIPGERVTVIDTKTVGPALGWIVEVAAHGAKSGWPKERILAAIQQVKEHTLTMVSFSDLKYLLHSGRVSHLKGIMASLLKIKPIIGMNETDGRYLTLGQEITLSRVVHKMAGIARAQFGAQQVKLQLMHGSNLPGVEALRIAVNEVLDCVEDELVSVTTVLGAHAGPTVIGLAGIPKVVFDAALK